MRRSTAFACVALLLSAGGSTAAAADSRCPYLPDYQALRRLLPSLPAASAAISLERYAGSHENPEGCESADIDRRLDAFERRQFVLRGVGKRPLVPDAVFRCNTFDATTAVCRSPMEDGTAQIDGPRMSGRRGLPSSTASLESTKAGAKLIGVYATTSADVLDGRAPSPLPPTPTQTLAAADPGRLLIAIYATDGAWKYRKVVWAF